LKRMRKMRFGTFLDRSHASLSKRAQSTTRTSLRFRINGLRAALNSVAPNPPSNRTAPRCDLYSAVYRPGPREYCGNCVRPHGVSRSLTGRSRGFQYKPPQTEPLSRLLICRDPTAPILSVQTIRSRRALDLRRQPGLDSWYASASSEGLVDSPLIAGSTLPDRSEESDAQQLRSASPTPLVSP
jgi:hypothetical protein